jgi:hypothetical protein
MIPARRQRFNQQYTPERYHRFVAETERRCGVPVEFPLSETPCFFPTSLLDRLVRVAAELIGQLLDNPAYRRAADAVVPAEFRIAAGEDRPTFLQVDFGLLSTPAGIESRLVELQAFPSLYGFQPLLAEVSQQVYGLDDVTPFLGGLDRETYVQLLRRVLIGDHDPNEVILMEIEPMHQKTRPDFTMTEQLWGVRAVDTADVTRDGRRLFYRRDGRLTRIARVYNRVIPDELRRRNLRLPFDYRDDLDVEWAGGPDWYFRISKFSIPWLRHPWVPATRYLSDVAVMPADRTGWLLKPLFSFAGTGILFEPTDAQIAAIPADDRHLYVLQERIAFTPVIETPFGPTQAEIRIMMVRDGDGYRAVLPLVRMGRGKMMGVDYNKHLQWVGAAAGLTDCARSE